MIVRALTISAALWLAATTVVAQVVGYNPQYYRPVTPPPTPGPPCGHYGTPPCRFGGPNGGPATADAPEGMTGDQLVQYSNQQIARGDKAGAVRTLERAAAMGNVTAMRGLGMAYAYGQGVPQETARGLHYLEQAEATGDAVAPFHLGVIYSEGKLIRADWPKAVRYLNTSAAKHFWNAEFALGIDAEVGLGMAHDRAAAINWFDRAARDTREQTPALYAAFLRRAGSQRFTSVQRLVDAYWSDYVRQHTAQPGGPGSQQWMVNNNFQRMLMLERHGCGPSGCTG